MLFATVRNRKIHVKKPDTVVQNGVKVDWLELDMDREWADMDSIVCVFVNHYTEEEEDVLVEKSVQKEMLHTFGEAVMVPWECLVNTGKLSVSCTGYVGGEQIMTTMYPDSFWEVVQNGPVSGDQTIEPTASLYDQILAAAGAANTAATAANEVKDQILQDKANGVFDGKDGVSPTVKVGTTTTAGPGGKAAVTASGTAQDVVLNFTIPTGPQGPRGEAGAAGTAGPKGDKGDPGEVGQSVGIDYVEMSSEDGGLNYVTFTDSTQLVVMNGSKGSTGAQGPKGDTGATGAQGPKGDTGATGPAGADGKTPVKGTDYWTESDKEEIVEEVVERVGSTGGSGTAGEDGYSPTATVTQTDNGAVITITDKSGTTTATVTNGKDGAQGPKGDTGAAGATGPKGDKGDKGDTGATGAQGPKGDTGATGATGPAGANGKDGTSITITDITMSAVDGGSNTVTFSNGKTLSVLNGTKGSTGAAGAQGPKGDTGAAGAQGPKGDTGATGAQGPKGDTGATGPAGADGKTPVKGTDYWTESDKEELVQDVLAALPTWTMGGSY